MDLQLSPYINPLENLRFTIEKKKFYKGIENIQVKKKSLFCNKIDTSNAKVKRGENLTKSTIERVKKVIECQWTHIICKIIIYLAIFDIVLVRYIYMF